MSFVYKHTNLLNGKAYIGWTSLTIKERWEIHLKAVTAGSQTKFHNAIRKYGQGDDVWKHEELEIHISNDEAKNAEIRLICEHKTYAYDHPETGYNMTKGGEGTVGHKRSEATKALDRRPKLWRRAKNHPLYGKFAYNRGNRTSEDVCLKQSIAHRNKLLSDAHIFAISNAMRGEKNPMYGKKRDPEWGRKSWETRRLNKKRKEIKQQIIFLSGPDRCGKSNIAAALSNAMNIKVFKASSEHHTFLGDQKAFLNDLRYADPRTHDLLFQICFSIIFDRGYPCERVYATFFKRETDHKVLKLIDDAYAKLGAKIVICTRRSFKGIVDDLNTSLDENALQQISDLYMEFVKWTKCQTYILYVDDEDLDREVTEIMNWLGEKK